MKKIGLGVLGLGEGRSIISAGVNSGLWHVAQLCDINEQLGRERCREFDLPPDAFTASFERLLANPTVDVVGIYRRTISTLSTSSNRCAPASTSFAPSRF